MIRIQGSGATRFSGFLARVQGEGAAVARQSILLASFLASKLLKQRTAWPQGGNDPFWGKLSPRAGPYLRGRSGMTSHRITGGGVVTEGRDAIGRTTYSARVGSPDAHVEFHERGGVIPGDFPGYFMSPAGYLRIPTAAAQFASGADRYGDRSIREIPGAFLFTSKAGNLWAAIREGAKLTLLYLLAKRSPRSGTHRARRIFETTQRDVEPALLRDVNIRIEGLLRG